MPDWISFTRATSSFGGDVDLLFVGLLATSLAVTFLLFALLLTFAIRYRVGSSADRDHRIRKSWYWEISWTTVTLIGFLALFVWGASLYLTMYGGPHDALPIYVVAKQWMWKAQHPGGQREINELHVPKSQPILLTMASEDVIHSFFVPAFRVKHDVVPGRYQTLWFKADKTGVFQLLCAEFCGTDHSRMTGRIIVMEPADYSSWLSHQNVTGTLASEGAELFRQLGCSGCHIGHGTVRSPPLDGLYGRNVSLQDGTFTVADDHYLRDSILLPNSQVVSGYAPLMPSFAGRVTEDELIRLIAYIKSLADNPGASP